MEIGRIDEFFDCGFYIRYRFSSFISYGRVLDYVILKSTNRIEGEEIITEYNSNEHR